ncbi:MAG: serine/threonine-protein kinase [Thermoanaerobaculia bacterium]
MAESDDSQAAAGDSARRSPLRLTPGKLIGDRYRIVTRLGGGGMSEVYRADDTRIGRYVALKFPLTSSADPSWSWRLVGEVEMAQSVSHPNVCRVHELGQHGKDVFVSMEFIDGDSLRRILSRNIGALSNEEKLRIAHDLCAGLAAIHDQRILHRDLKPENVMLNSSGRAVITDFGIASYAGGVTDRRSGTPAYIAPEIHAGEPPTPKSDLYSLCLVLYELFTGRLPFEAESDDDRLQLQKTGALALPDPERIDPAIRKAVVRGLAPTAEDRFESAVDLAAALPPSPEMAATAKQRRIVAPETLLVAPQSRLHRPTAWGLLAVALLALPLVAILGSAVQPSQEVAEGEPPVVLASRARDTLRQLGFDSPLKGSQHGYAFEPPDASHPSASDSGALTQLAPVRFWYRQSPERLIPIGLASPFSSYDDPPARSAGTVGVHLDSKGRLLRLDALPPRSDNRSGGAPDVAPDWEALFTVSGLDSTEFRQVPPAWTPVTFADRRRAWLGFHPDRDDLPIRVEAATFQGLPVGFRVFAGVAPASDTVLIKRPWRAATAIGRMLLALWFCAGLIAAVQFARRNLRRRTADRPAAFRVAMVVFIARILVWLLGSSHLPVSADIELLQAGLARSLLAAALVWILYVALEPTVRSLWPERAASWVRLLYGHFRDALVGRDLLIGVVFGLAALLWAQLYLAVPGWLGLSTPRPGSQSPLLWQIGQNNVQILCESLGGAARALAMGIFTVVHAMIVALFGVIGLALLRLVLRQAWLSRTTALLLLTLLTLPSDGHPAAAVIAAAVSSALWLTVVIRFGFLATVTATIIAWLLSSLPMTYATGAWTTGISASTLLVALAVTLWGFVAALDRQPPLRHRLFGLKRSSRHQPTDIGEGG